METGPAGHSGRVTPSAAAPAAAPGDRPDHGARSRPRRRHVVATVVVVLALAAVNVVRSLLPVDGLLLSVAAAATLLGFARATGLTWAQLGLARHRLPHGRRWAAAAIAVVAAVYLVGVALPWTRPAFLDSRYHLPLVGALLTAFWVIPVGTVLLEEVAFRSVLWAMLSRHMTTWRVVLVSSSLFGLWHVLPSLHFAASSRALHEVAGRHGPATWVVMLGTVAFTAAGGVVAAELRRRSGSLLASAGMHWATNALGVLFGLLAWRLAA